MVRDVARERLNAHPLGSEANGGDMLDPVTQIGPLAKPVIEEVAKPATIPIVTGDLDDREVGLDSGTGVLFACADDHFAITAAHLAWFTTTNRWALSVPCRNRGPVVLKECTVTHTGPSKNRHADDHIDIAVIHLRPELAADLLEGGYRFIRAPQLEPWHEPRLDAQGLPEKVLCMYGFPHGRALLDVPARKVEVNPQGVFLRATDAGATPHFDPQLHLALDYPDPKMLSVKNLSGETVQPSTPNGFSGGGVWSLPLSRIGCWAATDLRLVGIQVSWLDPTGPARCTKIGLPLSVIANQFPLLRPALGLASLERK